MFSTFKPDVTMLEFDLIQNHFRIFHLNIFILDLVTWGNQIICVIGSPFEMDHTFLHFLSSNLKDAFLESG